jgi:ABC-type Zn2+ transport system substrate-binding protein/surface adhesin
MVTSNALDAKQTAKRQEEDEDEDEEEEEEEEEEELKKQRKNANANAKRQTQNAFSHEGKNTSHFFVLCTQTGLGFRV